MRFNLAAGRWRGLVAAAASAVVALVSAAELLRLALLKRFSIDEFQYAHAAWLVSHGKLPYRDFFEFHFPLPYLSYSFLIGDDPLSILRLRGFMLGSFALTSAALYRINRREGVLIALAGPVLAATSAPFVFFATEIRPDALAFALLLSSLALLFPTPASPLRGFGVAAIWFLSLFASQKTLICSLPLAALLALNLIPSTRPARLFSSRASVVAGAALVALGIVAYFLVTRSASAWFEQTLRWAAYHERRYPGFSWTVYGEQALRGAPVLCALGLLGTWRTLSALRRAQALLGEPDLILVLVLASSLFSFGFARAPFPYALLPGLGMLAVFAPRGLSFALSLLARARISAKLRNLGVAALWLSVVALGPLVGVFDIEKKLATDNSYQRRVLADVARVTNIDDPVYDNSGGYVSRPHVGFRFYTSALDRSVEASELPITVPRAIREAGCTAFLFDLRFPGLPPALTRFVAQHFQPYDADLWLWGQRYSGSAEEVTFDAVRDAEYFVEPASVATAGALKIDGARVDASEFRLSAGLHRVEYRAGIRPFFLLWLPRNRQHYRPRYGQPPEFSTIF